MKESTSVLSIAESKALPKATQLAWLKKAKPGMWFAGWLPYCFNCDTMDRMSKRNYGFECLCCGGQVGWNLVRLKDSETKNSSLL